MPTANPRASREAVRLLVGKPFAITECGPNKRDGSFDNAAFIEAIRRHAPLATYFLYWHSWGDRKSAKDFAHAALVDNQNASRLLNDPWVINREATMRRVW